MLKALLRNLLAYLLFTSGLLFAQSFRAIPEFPKQGQILQIFGPPAARQARFNGKLISLFADIPDRGVSAQNTEPSTLGLMPVAARMVPGLYRLEWLDEHGAQIHAQDVQIADAHFTIQNVQLSPALAELHSTNDEREQVAKFFQQETSTRYWQLPVLPPLPGCLTSMFGVQRAHNGKLTGDIHAGLDQRGAQGTPIHAVAAGVVRLTGQFALHGGTVGIDHGQGLKSMYLHMSKIAVKPGDQVAAGDVVGFVGSTGRSTAPHLHWALYAAGEPVNPLQWLTLQPCAKKPTITKKKTRTRQQKTSESRQLLFPGRFPQRVQASTATIPKTTITFALLAIRVRASKDFTCHRCPSKSKRICTANLWNLRVVPLM